MESLTEERPLADTRYATLVVRMMLDQRGRLVGGVIIEAESGSTLRFVGWHELVEVLREWLTTRETTP